MITRVGGIRVGHCTDLNGATGCTVLICDEPMIGGVDVRGANPGTKDTDLLRPNSTMPEVHAFVLTGGSTFGLDAACGVSKWLEEQGRCKSCKTPYCVGCSSI